METHTAVTMKKSQPAGATDFTDAAVFTTAPDVQPSFVVRVSRPWLLSPIGGLRLPGSLRLRE